MKRAYSCVPLGSSRSTCSAPTIAKRNDFGLRLMVEKNTAPPGFASRAQAATTLAGFGTCSSISMQVTTSNALRRLGGHLLGGGEAVVDGAAGFQRVQRRDLERALGEVDAGHDRALRGHGLGEDAAAAAHVEHALAREAARRGGRCGRAAAG